MKAGDLFQYKKVMSGIRVGGLERKRIEHYGSDYVVYRAWSSKGKDLGERVMGRQEFDERAEPKGDFFAPGVIYTREAAWSIAAQRNNVTETFTCFDVKKNGNGLLVAFGRLTVPDSVGALLVDHWVIEDERSFNERGWRER